jgi:alkylglycerol monooxygenase
MNFIIYAIPIFFLLIAIELIAEKWRKTNYYRTNDAINSLSAGVLSQMTGLLKKLIPFTLYLMVFEHIQLFTLPNQWWVWLFAFVAYDFLYYWNHRLGHEINLLWAAHVVHHSSEEYNLTTALRQSSGSIVSWVFYLPLAIIGVDPVVLISVGSLNLIYQFWVHTRHIPKLGWYELFFVTPSNHRVHHAQNQIYLDRNYGGVFIIWDRIFGTFQEELDTQKPVYGIRKALQS